MKRGLIVIGIVSTVLLAGCHAQVSGHQAAAQHNQTTATKKLSTKQMTNLKERMYQLELSLAFYDNYIGNIGYNVQEGMNADTVAEVQEYTQKVLIEPQAAAQKTDAADLKAIGELKLPSKTVEKYTTDYQQLRTDQDHWITNLKNFNANNIAETWQALDAHQDEYRKLSTTFGKDQVALLKAGGMSDEEAGKTVQTLIKRAVKEVGDPTDAAKLNETNQ
ncbi:hypothetical protein [Furfurilactobacillus entadae]|uniref:hypothetical protein n=1 Tax=Furfurilactobacillus entadae TaxID=2922307 RepID=UPI0035EEFA45